MSDEPEVHSAEFFGPSRDLWWNRDWLELLARRLGWTSPLHILDVGCGQGHWGQALAHVLPAGSSIIGIDRETQSLDVARSRSAQLRELQVSFDYRVGDVLTIDFADDTFDVVTCQTLLIHLAEPRVALAEMLRVLRPGGWIVCAEPDILASSFVFSSITWEKELALVLEGAELEVRTEVGKARLGEGFNSAGELVPGWLASMNVEDVRVWISDKATPMWPPYDDPEQRIALDEARRQLAEQRWMWNEEKTRRYWLAGGGDPARFDELWPMMMASLAGAIDEMSRGTFHTAGGTLMYVIAARKVAQETRTFGKAADKVRQISSTADIDTLERAIVASAEATADELRAMTATTGIRLLARLKFERVGRDPLSDRPLNFIEQVNQTFTYLASCDALRYLFEHHPDRAPFVVHLGTAAGPDIESLDGTLIAEVFAATHPGSNRKLLKDARKLRARAEASHRYLFYSCPGEYHVHKTQLEPEVTIVPLGLRASRR